MAKPKPHYPEEINEGIQKLQKYYKEAVETRFPISNNDDHEQVLVNLHTQLAELGVKISKLRYKNKEKFDPDSDYSLQVAEIVFELVRLANSGYGEIDLAAAMKLQEEKHEQAEAERVVAAEKQKADWYDAQPKYHKEGSGLNPLRPDGLYGKAAQAADGDWYSSH